MKRSITRFYWLVVVFSAALFSPAFLFSGADEVTGNGFQSQPIHWNANSISYMVNPSGVAGFTTDLQKALVTGAVDDAFRAWTAVPGASLQFKDSGTTASSGQALDGVNVISFQDPNHLLPPGVLALTIPTFATTVGAVQLGNKTVNVDFAGQILDADIFFNPSRAFSPNGITNTDDIVAILTHEIGHLLGLDHTGVLSSIMDPFAEAGIGASSRSVQSDDLITAAALYAFPGALQLTGSISGRITNSSGSPVTGADVVAISLPAGVPVASQLSGLDGNGGYSITALPPGNYQILVEPFDGPIHLSNFPGFYSGNGQSNFASTFLGGNENPGIVSVSAGQNTPADVSVGVAPANLLNIDRMSGVPASQANGGLSFSSSPLFLPRGGAYGVYLTGSNFGLDSNIKFSSPDIALQGGPSSPSLVGISGARAQNISISPTAALGPSDISIANTTSTSVMPGGVVVTVNPKIVNIFNAASSGTQTATRLAPGTLFSLYGADIAAKPDNWLGAPAPTSLGGISVKVGDRYAPLFLACPGPQSCGQFQQINGMIPFEAPVGTVPITIVTGPNASGNTVNVTLSPTAPGIFSVDSSGNGQGAILNGADNTVASPAGQFPGSHPASAGDVVVIYASGLGPVTPSLPSGVGSGANGSAYPQLSRPPQVIIGGVNVPPANIQFAGLTPGYVGLYQLNVQVPPKTNTGSAVDVQVITAEGQASNIVTMAVNP